MQPPKQPWAPSGAQPGSSKCRPCRPGACIGAFSKNSLTCLEGSIVCASRMQAAAQVWRVACCSGGASPLSCAPMEQLSRGSPTACVTEELHAAHHYNLLQIYHSFDACFPTTCMTWSHWWHALWEHCCCCWQEYDKKIPAPVLKIIFTRTARKRGRGAPRAAGAYSAPIEKSDKNLCCAHLCCAPALHRRP
jgi:hypothetical protein